MIRSVPKEHFREVYPKLEAFFASFVERAHGGVVEGLLEAEVMGGKRQCYVAVEGDEIKGCALSEVAPNGDISLTHCSGRDREEWQEEMLRTFEEWAADEGVGLAVYCRQGWVRALKMKERGYRETHRVMELRHV